MQTGEYAKDEIYVNSFYQKQCVEFRLGRGVECTCKKRTERGYLVHCCFPEQTNHSANQRLVQPHPTATSFRTVVRHLTLISITQNNPGLSARLLK